MSVPTSELQAWLSSQCPEGVPSWEITEDTLALLSSLYRRYSSREEEARLEVEQLEVARQEVFGLSSYRPDQLAVMNATMSGHDCLLIMPTGNGGW